MFTILGRLMTGFSGSLLKAW